MSAEFGGSALARAKVNLALHVTGRRPDGYHSLSSLVAFADVGDDIRVSASGRDRLTVDGPFAAQVPGLTENLLGKALALVRRWQRDDIPRGVSIKLTKNLPISSGIGGGSADAAALIGLLTGGRELSPLERADTLSLGADIPMCLTGGAALVSGIGEELDPIEIPALAAILVNPGEPVSTPEVFRALEQQDNAGLPAVPAVARVPDFTNWLRGTRNDLETPAISLEPTIGAALDAMGDARISRMSGSGATCFGIFDSRRQANAAAHRVQASHPHWWVVTTTLS
ncbi:MAG: 4-(cytidine 5'-diphospho)-2-C-methyl-D-erythritol kinase [Pseudomonadota bacterium]